MFCWRFFTDEAIWTWCFLFLKMWLVNLIWLGHGVPRHCVKHYSGCRRVFWDEINIWRQSLMWAALMQSGEGLNRTTLTLLQVEGNSSCWMPSAGTSVFSSFQTQTETSACSGSLACQLLNWTYRFSWFSGLWTRTRTTPSALLGLQLVDCRSWSFSAFIITWINFL